MAKRLTFAIIDANREDSGVLQTFLSRTFIDCPVHQLESVSALDQVKEGCDVVLADALTIVNSFPELLQYPNAYPRVRLILLQHHRLHSEESDRLGFHGRLGKPVSQKELRELLLMVLQLPARVKLGNRLLKPSEIICCIADGWRTKIVLRTGMVIHKHNLGEVQKLLTPYGFVRINPQVLINRDEIAKIDESHKTYRVKLTGHENEWLPVSDKLAYDLLELFSPLR